MAITPEGADALWRSQQSWVIRVSDGTTTASRIAKVVSIENGTLTLEAEFESDEANFEWRRRDIAMVVPGGSDITFDREDIDLGRKAEGSIWTLACSVELLPA